MISTGVAGMPRAGNSPKYESQIRVKTPAFATPPLSRMKRRAFASAGSSGECPTSLSAK